MSKISDSGDQKAKTIRRLSSYWKIEAINIFLMPGLVFLIMLLRTEEKIGVPLVLSMFATSWLLVVGTIALRMMYLSATGDRSFEERWIGRLYYLKWPSLIVVIAAIGGTFWESIQTLPEITASWVACLALTLLATAEYINYYHFQLQHFDNLADFRRLLAGRGFRKSHLARAISRWKSSNFG